jgi:hypothetical protein
MSAWHVHVIHEIPTTGDTAGETNSDVKGEFAEALVLPPPVGCIVLQVRDWVDPRGHDEFS